MNVFTFSNYRTLLHAAMEERKLTDPQASFQSLGVVVGIQKSYLSKVLHDRADLNNDQLFLIGEYFQWTAEEADFAQLLLDWDRCDVAKRKAALLAKIEKIQRQKQGKPEAMPESTVYLDSYAELIHKALFLARFSEDPSAITQILPISQEQLTAAIDRLMRLGLVRRKKNLLVATGQVLAVPTPSSSYRTQKIVLIDQNTRDRFQREAIQLLEQLERESKTVKPHELFQVNLDFIPWTKSG